MYFVLIILGTSTRLSQFIWVCNSPPLPPVFSLNLWIYKFVVYSVFTHEFERNTERYVMIMRGNRSVAVRQIKIWYLFLGFFAVVVTIFSRLFYLQINQGTYFVDLGNRNFLKNEVVSPLRGNVYDSSGVLLATNKPYFDLYWYGSGARMLSEHHKELIAFVEKTLACTIDYRVLSRVERMGRSIIIKKNLSFDELCHVSERVSPAGSIRVKSRFERVYPHKTIASHVLGHVNRVERVGQNGLEKFFEDQLSGESGYKISVINSTGRELLLKEFKDAQAGSDITLTLDINLQSLAETVFSEGDSGIFLLMDPEDGAIKAMVSYPNFDPNMFLYPISESTWNDHFITNNPLLNRVTCALYPPASIFKLVTVTAGLEEGIINEDSVFDCKGYVKLGRKHWCIRRWGHGLLDTKKGLAFSCNVPCYEIAKQLTIDQLADYAVRFGLGYKTHFVLPEKSGLIPTSAWKMATKGEQWWPGETLSASIGQSYLLVTPLQIGRMICAIFSGYLVKPRILDEQPVEKDVLSISSKTLDIIRRSMALAVGKGTVQRLKYLKEFEIYAKTGTGQTCSLKKQKTAREHYEHAWLTGCFSYKNQKPLVMIILLEHAGAALPAVKAADRFLQAYRVLQQSQMSQKSEVG